MKIAIAGKDVIKINENNINLHNLYKDTKIHLIKLDFNEPTEDKINDIIEKFSNTNRFIISDKNNIKLYNNVLKHTSKKYYIQNTFDSNMISFLRKNNKILLSFPVLNDYNKLFFVNNFKDLLRNVEVVLMNEEDFYKYKSMFKFWNGNIILDKENILI